MIKAPGYETLITHVFRDGDRYLDSDAVFGVRQSLIADWVQQPDGTLPGRIRLRAEPGQGRRLIRHIVMWNLVGTPGAESTARYQVDDRTDDPAMGPGEQS